jgi:hypothetical protein
VQVKHVVVGVPVECEPAICPEGLEERESRSNEVVMSISVSVTGDVCVGLAIDSVYEGVVAIESV